MSLTLPTSIALSKALAGPREYIIRKTGKGKKVDYLALPARS